MDNENTEGDDQVLPVKFQYNLKWPITCFLVLSRLDHVMARLSDSQVLNLWTKSYSGTIQMKCLWQYIKCTTQILCDTIILKFLGKLSLSSNRNLWKGLSSCMDRNIIVYIVVVKVLECRVQRKSVIFKACSSGKL